jgi:hypothetical protein
MKYLLLSLLFLSSLIGQAQQTNLLYQIKYKKINNNIEEKEKITIKYCQQKVYLSKPEEKIQSFIDLKERENSSTISLDNQLYKVVTPHDSLPKFTPIDKEETILGYECQAVVYSYFSNTIEVWFTEETKAKGSPYAKFLPNNKALVLKIIINGNRRIVASSIQEEKESVLPDYLPEKAKQLSKAEFEEFKINSRFTKLPIFEEEQIYFDGNFETNHDTTLISDKVYHFSKGAVVLKKIRIPDTLSKSAYIIAELTQKSNGDAYDRTGSVYILPETSKLSMLDAYLYGLDTIPSFKDKRGKEYQGFTLTKEYEPPVELIRFFTSFGAGHFSTNKINNYPWSDEVIYKQDVTSLIPNDNKEIIIAVFIGNYDKGGHKISLDLNFYPAWDEKKQPKKYIQSLFSTVNTMEMQGQNYGRLFKTDTLSIPFEITDTINNLKLLYTSTGHGGWGEGDEFIPRLNQVFVDENKVFSILPWRSECATYRFFNPASGNFGNGLSSSDLSRSNWCPGTLTPPYVIPLDDIGVGKHTLKIVIQQGEDVDSSFSAWGVSGTLTGTYPQK